MYLALFSVCVNSIVNAIFHPYSMYTIATAIEKPRPSGNPCINNPCGPFSQCRAIGDTPACSCLPNYIGRAPNCRPECVISAECPSNLACINQKCSDPCVGACGAHTYCTAINHNSICKCDPGYTGDPFSICSEIPKCKMLANFFCILYFIKSFPINFIFTYKIFNFCLCRHLCSILHHFLCHKLCQKYNNNNNKK